MNKFKAKLLLPTLFIFTNILSFNVQAEENTPKTPEKKGTSILEAILSIFKSPENRFITRNSTVCLISPGNSGQQLIWSDRPLFIWQGETMEPQINLFSLSTNDDDLSDQEPIWNEILPSNIRTIAYTGEQLQPGVTYEWELISHGKPYRRTIVVMEQSQREAIDSELTALSNKLETNNATAEDIAIARADYFLQQKLGSDALQELYSVENPSSNLAEQINEIEQYLCNLNF